ncbi:integrase [Halobacteriales archaeon QH_7_65_31]|nr:MAG: integrase [Halobacteriales archaeon QH_7_65_31]
MADGIPPQQAVELYLKDRKPDITKSTYRNHKYHLNSFLEWAKQTGLASMNEMTGKHIYEYKIWRRDTGDINALTLSNQLSTLRVFLSFCGSIEAAEEGLAEKVMTPDIDPEEMARDKAIDIETANEILGYLDTYEYASLRHTLFYLLWHTGIRTGTIHSLDIDDYHSEGQYIEIQHRPDQGTRLKNKSRAEREIHIKQEVCDVLEDYIKVNRHDVEDDHGREPLFTTSSGRAYKSLIQKHIYVATRPCHYSGNCPHNEDIEACEASDFNLASKCPSSVSPHPIRRSAITAHLNADVPKEIASDRMNVSVSVLDKHYDARTETEKRELRRDYLDNV